MPSVGQEAKNFCKIGIQSCRKLPKVFVLSTINDDQQKLHKCQEEHEPQGNVRDNREQNHVKGTLPGRWVIRDHSRYCLSPITGQGLLSLWTGSGLYHGPQTAHMARQLCAKNVDTWQCVQKSDFYCILKTVKAFLSVVTS